MPYKTFEYIKHRSLKITKVDKKWLMILIIRVLVFLLLKMIIARLKKIIISALMHFDMKMT